MDAILEGVLRVTNGAQPLSVSDRKRLAEALWVLWTSWPRYTEIVGSPDASEQEILRNHESIEFILKPYLDAKYYKAVINHTKKFQSFDEGASSKVLRAKAE